MTGCRDMDKKHQKCPQNGGFPPFATPEIFFKNRALSLLYPYGVLISCKKLEKTNERSLRYSKTVKRARVITSDQSGSNSERCVDGLWNVSWDRAYILEDVRKLTFEIGLIYGSSKILPRYLTACYHDGVCPIECILLEDRSTNTVVKIYYVARYVFIGLHNFISVLLSARL